MFLFLCFMLLHLVIDSSSSFRSRHSQRMEHWEFSCVTEWRKSCSFLFCCLVALGISL
ncbi:hypothetical protein YC2023_078089 [Brassica napus]